MLAQKECIDISFTAKINVGLVKWIKFAIIFEIVENKQTLHYLKFKQRYLLVFPLLYVK